MQIQLLGVKIISPRSAHHLKIRNVLIQQGKIISISTQKHDAEKTIQADGLLLSSGWVDIGASVGDPGFEYREDLQSANKCAAAGGFTDVVLLPNTKPVLQTKNDVHYVLKNNDNRLVQFYPMAAVSKDTEGKEMTEMIDLHHAGAVAFSDGLQSVWNTDLFLKTLQYLQPFNGLLVNHPTDSLLQKGGQMHEGEISTRLGLRGIPTIAEDVAMSQHIELLHYAGGRLHVHKLSTPHAIKQLKKARKKGLKISGDMAIYQLLFTDEQIENFDTNWKVNPPLRDSEHVTALRKEWDETIDVLCSGHAPFDSEEKEKEFEFAEFGMSNWQTFASQLCLLHEQGFSWETLVPKITDNPRQIFGLPDTWIDENQKANLTLFNPNEEWTLEEETNFSKSKNSPWWNKKVKGKVVAVFNNGKQVFF